jgi:putative restriction endonuclease
MAFGVFIHRADSIYDDRPAERYQFPSQYLSRAQTFVGDWILYYEPRKVAGTRGYFAVAKVQRIIPDPGAPGMFVAVIEEGSYLPFPDPVPFGDAEGPIERGLLNDAGAISGRAQAAVRPISAADFNRIIELGLGGDDILLPRDDDPALEADPMSAGLQDERAPFQFEQARDRIGYFGSRIVRDRIFRRVVLRAYDARCAITGLKLINGGGRAEVQAAHIRPVEENGPDIINNGLALSGTVHWMFDRGLISLEDDLRIKVSRQINDPDGVHAMINKSGHALPPLRPADRPHPHFLKWHRENRFKL